MTPHPKNYKFQEAESINLMARIISKCRVMHQNTQQAATN